MQLGTYQFVQLFPRSLEVSFPFNTYTLSGKIAGLPSVGLWLSISVAIFLFLPYFSFSPHYFSFAVLFCVLLTSFRPYFFSFFFLFFARLDVILLGLLSGGLYEAVGNMPYNLITNSWGSHLALYAYSCCCCRRVQSPRKRQKIGGALERDGASACLVHWGS